jgi:hypothetical protein
MVLVVDFSWVPKLETSATKITGHLRNRLIGGTYHIRGLSGNIPRKYGLKNMVLTKKPPFKWILKFPLIHPWNSK